MKRLLRLLIYIPLICFTACDVHELPEIPESVSLHLKLSFETNITEWEHLHEKGRPVEQGLGKTYDNHLKNGKIRHIIRTYPISEKERIAKEYLQEFIFTGNIGDGYDHEVTLDVIPGNYSVKVWSDLLPDGKNTSFYNADNFAEIKLQGEHEGNTDHRDAFRGTGNVSLVADITDRAPDTLSITMQRPLAKFEIITDDVQKFIDKELAYLTKEAETRGETRVNTDDYKVIFAYAGYMPNAYSINTDKPVDSAMGVLFESKLDLLNEHEASLGFDYVFVNGRESGVSVQIGLYDKKDRQIAVSEPIDIPLRRSHHTLLRGAFLVQEASGGINIKPDFDGNHNIVIE